MLKATRKLEALNFFAADIQAGVGPFLGVYLLAQGWGPDRIGTLMTLAGIIGMLATSPAGALVDATMHRRAVVAGAGAMTLCASIVIGSAHAPWLVSASQFATAIGGAAMGPALIGLTLGIVRQKNFNRQFGRNQVYNHAGNLVAAALSGWLGWRFGLPAVFMLNGAFGLLTIATVFWIPAKAVDYHHARGLVRAEAENDPKAGRFHVLLKSRPLMLLAIALALSNIGNSAMMPLYSLAVVATGHANPGAFTAQTIVIAQLVMLVAALFANRLMQRIGYWRVVLITLLMVPLRGLLGGFVLQTWGVWPMQTFDGIGAGLQSVVVPALVVRLLHGTGRVNLGQGVVQTIAAFGACVSPALGGLLAQRFGYANAFLCLGGTSLAAVAIWIACRHMIRDGSRRDVDPSRTSDLDPSPSIP